MLFVWNRTEKLRFNPDENNPKASLLDLKPVLTNALELRPDTNIVGGSVKQDFNFSAKMVCIIYICIYLVVVIHGI